jgi:hypothetical protein
MSLKTNLWTVRISFLVVIIFDILWFLWLGSNISVFATGFMSGMWVVFEISNHYI